MDKNKFWLGGRLFNTPSPRLGAPTQRKARPQDGGPNATQGTSASWAPQRNATHVCKLGAPTHVRNARHVGKLGAPTHVRNARHVCTSATQGKARPQRKARHVRNARHVGKLGGPTHVRKLGGPTHVRNANSRHVRNLGAPTQRKARPQDGRPNAKLIRNENVHTREH
jgi:hypothetical protein